MKARDIMIGDWVRTEAGELIVAGISQKIYCRDDSGNPTHIWEVTTIEPIPLTDEILLKNGFKPQGTGWILEDSVGERIFNLCRISNAYCLLTAGMTLAFQHVHELQHLFRIAGMTREIKL